MEKEEGQVTVIRAQRKMNNCEPVFPAFFCSSQALALEDHQISATHFFSKIGTVTLHSLYMRSVISFCEIK